MGDPPEPGKRFEQPHAVSYSRSYGRLQSSGLQATREQRRRLQDEMELQDELLRSRLPASQKGKAAQGEQCIHGGQPRKTQTTTIELSPSLDSASPDEAATKSTRLRNHKLDEINGEDGWEPAKVHHRKQKDSEMKIIQSTSQPQHKPTGSTFFRSKMEGKCYNCFSPNHLAHSCHRRPRCWKCYFSGHRAMQCSFNTFSTRQERHIRERQQELHRPTPSQELSTKLSSHKTDHRSYV